MMAVIIFFLPLGFHLFNFGFYEKLYSRNDVYEVLDQEDVKAMTSRVFDFFRYRGSLEGNVRFTDTSMSRTAFFTDSEISHMWDVRRLIRNIFVLCMTCLVLLPGLLIVMVLVDRNSILRNTGLVFLWSSSAVLLLLLILLVLSANFSSLFDRFHLIFFPQGNYMFPEGSLLITMFPFGFFYQFFIRLALSSAVIAVIILMGGIALTVKGRRRKKA